MSRPGGKKRGKKSTGPGPHRGPNAQKYQQPFPREATKPVTPPGMRPGDTLRDANAAWFAWLRIISNLSQMQLPPHHRKAARF